MRVPNDTIKFLSFWFLTFPPCANENSGWHESTVNINKNSVISRECVSVGLNPEQHLTDLSLVIKIKLHNKDSSRDDSSDMYSPGHDCTDICTHLVISVRFTTEGRKKEYVPNKRRRRKRTPRA